MAMMSRTTSTPSTCTIWTAWSTKVSRCLSVSSPLSASVLVFPSLLLSSSRGRPLLVELTLSLSLSSSINLYKFLIFCFCKRECFLLLMDLSYKYLSFLFCFFILCWLFDAGIMIIRQLCIFNLDSGASVWMLFSSSYPCVICVWTIERSPKNQKKIQHIHISINQKHNHKKKKLKPRKHTKKKPQMMWQICSRA